MPFYVQRPQNVATHNGLLSNFYYFFVFFIIYFHFILLWRYNEKRFLSLTNGKQKSIRVNFFTTKTLDAGANIVKLKLTTIFNWKCCNQTSSMILHYISRFKIYCYFIKLNLKNSNSKRKILNFFQFNRIF